jgi:hypothetical protein
MSTTTTGRCTVIVRCRRGDHVSRQRSEQRHLRLPRSRHHQARGPVPPRQDPLIHPSHLDRIDPAVSRRIFLEVGYGEHFGVADDRLASLVGGLRSREQLVAECDVILLPKPTAADLADFRAGHVLWGWPHCVQDETITQLGIDRRLTLIAWEAMNHWAGDGAYRVHVFHKNNELAG